MCPSIRHHVGSVKLVGVSVVACSALLRFALLSLLALLALLALLVLQVPSLALPRLPRLLACLPACLLACFCSLLALFACFACLLSCLAWLVGFLALFVSSTRTEPRISGVFANCVSCGLCGLSDPFHPARVNFVSYFASYVSGRGGHEGGALTAHMRLLGAHKLTLARLALHTCPRNGKHALMCTRFTIYPKNLKCSKKT